MCVCVLKLLRYCDAMSCLPIVSDRAATEGSKYFELGRQPHEFLTRNTCFVYSSAMIGWIYSIIDLHYAIEIT